MHKAGALSQLFAAGLVGSLLSVRSAQSLLTQQSRRELDGTIGTGYPYVFETLLFFPFIAQCGFYLHGLWRETKSAGAVGRALSDAVPHLGPCIFYSVLSAAGPIFETESMGYLEGSTVIIIKQLTILFIAFFEVVLLSSYPTFPLLAVMLAQCGMVVAFNSAGSCQIEEASLPLAPRAPGPQPPPPPGFSPAALQVEAFSEDSAAAAAVTFGMMICLVSVALSSLGSILQQKYLQRQAQSVPLNAKLFYQHAVGFFVVLIKLGSNSNSVGRVLSNGFFDGWNAWALAVSVCTWLCYFFSTAVTAHVSAMAGAMAQAVTIVSVGIGEYLLFNKQFSNMQWCFMVGICMNAMVFMHFKAKASEAEKVREAKKTDPKSQ